MSEQRYVAAIEISSSKIMAVVGKAREAGQLDIIACEQEKGVEAVKYGVIQNLEETALRINRIINKIQHNPAVAPRKISGVFVGLSARSVRSISTEVRIQLPEETEITEEILNNLKTQALHTAIDSSLEVVDAVPRIYTVGITETASPKGMVGNSISAVFDLIVCRPEIRRNLQRTIQDKLGLRIEGMAVTALSVGQLILTPEQRRLGCMLVDMGAETTTVTIYKGGHLRYFATLPLGGRNITRDMTSEKMLEERAEDIKLTSGNAIARENPTTLNFHGVSMDKVANIIVARAEEIVANIVEQIDYAELKEQDLPAGIICIGGGSKLAGMLDLLSTKSGLSVKRGTLPLYIKVEDPKASSSEIIEIASVLYSGAMESDIECVEDPKAEELPVTGTAPEEEEEKEEKLKVRKPKKEKKRGWLNSFSEKIAGIFVGPDMDDSDLFDE